MKHNKKYNKSLTMALFIILAVSMAALTGCGSKKQVITLLDNTANTTEQSTDLNTGENNAAQQDNSVENTANSSEDENTITSTQTLENTAEENTAEEETGETNTSSGEANNLDKLVGLLGLTKEEISKETGEEPSKIDEGGLEFKDYGIRVWFDADSKVNQIFLLSEDIDLNGIKTGDKISAFKEVFGNPVKDNNGDAHFKYGDVYLSVNYEKDTLKTYGVYILSEDF